MTSRPMISVVTVSKDDPGGLARTQRSIDSQRYTAWENIVQVHSSTAGASKSVGQALSDKRLVYAESDSGIYDAMNRATARASGDLVMFLNSGDAFASPESLLFVAQSWLRERWDWAYGAVHHGLDDEDAYIYPYRRVSSLRVTLGLETFPHPACVFTSALLDQIGFYRTDIGNPADQELCLRADAVSSPGWIPQVLVRFEGGGASSGNSSLRHEKEFHKLRRASGRLVGHSQSLDGLWTLGMAGLRGVSKLQPKRKTDRS